MLMTKGGGLGLHSEIQGVVQEDQLRVWYRAGGSTEGVVQGRRINCVVHSLRIRVRVFSKAGSE